MSEESTNGRFVKGHIPANKKSLEYKDCKYCGKKFLKDTKNPSTKNCSPKCGWASLRGRPKSVEHKDKIKMNHARYWLGKKQTREHVLSATRLLKDYQSGERHWNWKGGLTPLYKKLRMTSQYKEWRTSVYQRDNYTCQMCGVRGSNLNADHIIPFAKIVKDKNWVLLNFIGNGRTLCVNCHKLTPTYGVKGYLI